MKVQPVIWKEEDMYVIKDKIPVTTQGKTVEQAKANLKEAVELYLDE